MEPDTQTRTAADHAVDALGLRNLLLCIHDVSYPATPGRDLGRGSPYGTAAHRLLRFARRLGFRGLQFGPQGLTTPGNASPYDGALFSREILSIDPFALADDAPGLRLLPRAFLDPWTAGRPGGADRRADLPYARRALAAALTESFRAFQDPARADLAPLRARFEDFRREYDDALEADALYEILAEAHGSDDWRRWPPSARLDRSLLDPPPADAADAAARIAALRAAHSDRLARYDFAQFLVREQHRSLRRSAQRLRLKLFGDLAIGISLRDVWAHRSILLPGYFLGAPPSRTNPEGQPWGYPVLHPGRYRDGDGPGPVARFLARRIHLRLEEYDGLRIDHPHGLVCPWVYRDDDPDPHRAVRAGARLFSSPDLPDHPALAPYSLVGPEALDRGLPRHADRWVRAVTPEQVDRYAFLMDVLIGEVRRAGRRVDDVACEVLSTMPEPLGRILQRYGLGRFRVVQKADPEDPLDPYRTASAAPPDWVMIGTHDTPPLWTLLPRWCASGRARAWAEYLARRLVPEPERRPAFVTETAADPGRLARALCADLFVGPAANVQIFFTDLLGMTQPYNVPGTVSDDNWSLRVPPDYETAWPANARAGRALDLHGALALALRARGADFARAHAGLLRVLEQGPAGATAEY